MPPPVLDVYVAGAPAGMLTQEGHSHVFAYLPNTPAERFVSLTMPVRLQSYVWPALHPVFQMNLPEGHQKDTLRRRFGPVATVDDLSLLALTGRRTIGRVQVVVHGSSLDAPQPALDLAALLSSSDAQQLFLAYVERGLAEGVSGIMPKSLAGEHDKAVLTTDQFVVKTGPFDVPGLALNEFLCLEVARRAGLEVPEAQLSADGNVLAVRRFDRTAEGTMLGLEDFCALEGLSPHEKYSGSMERIARLLEVYAGEDFLGASRERLLRLALVNYALHNSDAHLKNYALLYSTASDVRLAPVFDVLTVTAYPEFRQDLPALTLYGKKTWGAGVWLARYAAQWLKLNTATVRHAVEAVCDAIRDVAPLVQQYASQHDWLRETAKRMLDAWDAGIGGIQPNAKSAVGVEGLRERLGLSDEKRIAKKRSR
jgi:serine/threonine-protein kinase HipA